MDILEEVQESMKIARGTNGGHGGGRTGGDGTGEDVTQYKFENYVLSPGGGGYGGYNEHGYRKGGGGGGVLINGEGPARENNGRGEGYGGGGGNYDHQKLMESTMQYGQPGVFIIEISQL